MSLNTYNGHNECNFKANNILLKRIYWWAFLIVGGFIYKDIKCVKEDEMD